VKYFWWGQILIGANPILWFLDDSGNPTQDCNGAITVSNLLDSGYQEISTTTAYVLGLPT
jgi:hypothetical protein